jgi:ribosomal protein L32
MGCQDGADVGRLQVDDPTECPACGRIAVLNRVCGHCHVALPAQMDRGEWPGYRRYPRRRPDQDHIGRMTDYARTKDDKA